VTRENLRWLPAILGDVHRLAGGSWQEERVIIVAGTIDLADPAAMDECLRVITPLQQATREEEPGCLAYCFAADPVVPGRIQVYELWDSQASLAAHFEHPNYRAMRTAFATIGLKSADNHKFRVDRREPVYDERFRPRADFFTAP
jgi:quinol monooxygenase YgiN